MLRSGLARLRRTSRGAEHPLVASVVATVVASAGAIATTTNATRLPAYLERSIGLAREPPVRPGRPTRNGGPLAATGAAERSARMQSSASRDFLGDGRGRAGSEDGPSKHRNIGLAGGTPVATTSPDIADAVRADMSADGRTARPPSPDTGAGSNGHLRTRRTAPLSASASVTRAVLTGVMLALTVGISVGAGWLSFLAVRDLAMLAGWPAGTAWAVQPVVELFLVVGSLEIVCRAWEGRTDLRYPAALIAAALVVVLAANVADHVLQAAAERRSGPMLAVVGLLAALVPAAQLGSLHLISGRLHALGGRTTGHPVAVTTMVSTAPNADIRPAADAAPGADTRVAADNRPDAVAENADNDQPLPGVSSPPGRRTGVRPAPVPPTDDRAALVAAVLTGRMSPAEAARRAGRDIRTIRRWVAAHRASGAQPGGSALTVNRTGPQPVSQTAPDGS